MASINHLSEEIIIKILSWLPVLSLLKCNSVCKSWKSIISDPHFIQAHLTISHNKPPPFSLLRVVSGGEFQGVYIHTRGEDSVKLTLPLRKSYPSLHFYVCSCNGLVILSDRHINVLKIWNPLTRLFKVIPRSEIFPRYYFIGLDTSIGFGFDSVSHDYKLLRIVFVGRSFSGDNDSVMFAELYSVNEDSWKEIRVPKEMHGFGNIAFSQCVCVDSGVLYLEGVEEILSFDLHDEVFGLFQYPNSGGRNSFLLNVDGSLAVIMKSGGGGSVLSLWKLDGIADKVSWTKMFNIEPDFNIDRFLLYLGDSQFLARDLDGGYFFYDDRKKWNKIPLTPVCRNFNFVVKFTGSLVSLKGFEQQE